MQGGGGRRLSRSTESRAIHLNPSDWTKSRAFTMAEILLSLTIIGVVAAITLPSLTGNINERTWNTQRKALYARFSQAIALMPALNGYGTLDETTDTAAETFVTAGLSKVLKINNICDSEHFKDCGIPNKFSDLQGDTVEPFPTTLVDLNSMFSGSTPNFNADGSLIGYYTYNQSNTKAAAFETANGESIVAYYSPNCRVNGNEQARGLVSYQVQPFLCANFIYDLNGSKGPNAVGKDIGFISVLYPSDSVVVAPMPLQKSAGGSSWNGGAKLCRKQDSNSRMPNRDELAAMFYNRLLLGIDRGAYYWSGTIASSTNAYRQRIDNGYAESSPLNNGSNTVHCVKR